MAPITQWQNKRRLKKILVRDLTTKSTTWLFIGCLIWRWWWSLNEERVKSLDPWIHHINREETDVGFFLLLLFLWFVVKWYEYADCEIVEEEKKGGAWKKDWKEKWRLFCFFFFHFLLFWVGQQKTSLIKGPTMGRAWSQQSRGPAMGPTLHTTMLASCYNKVELN